MQQVSWIIIGLAAFDCALLALCYLSLRNQAPLQQRTLFASAVGLLGFVFHAFMFFSGAFLILQLATIAGIFAICVFAPRAPRASAGDHRPSV